MNDAVKTKIRAGGLRYESKSTGTDFPGPFAGTMSCFMCGRHVPRAQLVSFKLAGVHHLRGPAAESAETTTLAFGAYTA